MLIFADSFDHYGTTPNGGRDAMLAGAWAQITVSGASAPSVSSVRARTGGNSLRMPHDAALGGKAFARRVLGGAQVSVGIGAAFFRSALPTTNGSIGLEVRNNANDSIAGVTIESDGALGLYIGSGHALHSSSDPVVTAGAWNHIEVKFIIDDIVGEVEARVNGKQVLHATDLNLGVLGATQMAIGHLVYAVSPASGDLYVDDVFAWNDSGLHANSFLGPQRILTTFPVSDTVQADWAKVGAANGYDCIDNVPPDGDTTYLSGVNVGDVSEFGLDTLPPELAGISGVYIPAMGKLDAPGVGNLQISMVSNGETESGEEHGLTSGYAYYGSSFEVDPDTGEPWTKEALEAALLRIEKTL